VAKKYNLTQQKNYPFSRAEIMKKIVIIAIATFALIQCAKKENPFLIQNGKIGGLQKEFTLTQIDSVFAKDSIVKPVTDDEFTGNINDIEIYQKDGKHLLSLSPNDNKTINIITIHDSRYKTDKGIGLNSTFKDFRTQYSVNKIDRMLNNIIIDFKNQDFYITIDVKELPSEYWFNFDTKIETVSIPDNAKIKSIQLDWM